MSDVIYLDQFRGVRAAQQPTSIARLEPKHHPILAARPERERRQKLWREASTHYDFYAALCAITWVADMALHEYGIEDARPLAPTVQYAKSPFVEKHRIALAALLLTPAPYLAYLKIKVRLRSKHHMAIDKAILRKIDKEIAADEAWLLANAGHRSRRRK